MDSIFSDKYQTASNSRNLLVSSKRQVLLTGQPESRFRNLIQIINYMYVTKLVYMFVTEFTLVCQWFIICLAWCILVTKLIYICHRLRMWTSPTWYMNVADFVLLGKQKNPCHRLIQCCCLWPLWSNYPYTAREARISNPVSGIPPDIAICRISSIRNLQTEKW